MKKTTLLGLCNIVLIFWFLFILSKSNYSYEPLISLESALKAYTTLLIILFFLAVNTYLAYLLLLKPPKKPVFSLLSAVTIAPLFWFICMAIGAFFTSNPILPLVTFFFSLSLYFFFKRYSQKISLFLSLGTFCVMTLMLLSNFEEDYCWRQGEIADQSGANFMTASANDAIMLKDYGVTEGSQIGVSFRSHMLCHQNFHFFEAIQKNYFQR